MNEEAESAGGGGGAVDLLGGNHVLHDAFQVRAGLLVVFGVELGLRGRNAREEEKKNNKKRKRHCFWRWR